LPGGVGTISKFYRPSRDRSFVAGEGAEGGPTGYPTKDRTPLEDKTRSLEGGAEGGPTGCPTKDRTPLEDKTLLLEGLVNSRTPTSGFFHCFAFFNLTSFL